MSLTLPKKKNRMTDKLDLAFVQIQMGFINLSHELHSAKTFILVFEVLSQQFDDVFSLQICSAMLQIEQILIL